MIERVIIQKGGKEFVVSTVLPEETASSATTPAPDTNAGTTEESPETEGGE